MTDREFLETADSIIAKARVLCCQVLELVDLLGEDRAFLLMNQERNYSRPLFRKMLHANSGASDVDLIEIAVMADRENSV